MKEAVHISETSVYFCEATWRYIPEGCYLNGLPNGKILYQLQFILSGHYIFSYRQIQHVHLISCAPTLFSILYMFCLSPTGNFGAGNLTFATPSRLCSFTLISTYILFAVLSYLSLLVVLVDTIPYSCFTCV
jgi:hypothetical protein